MQVNFQIFFSRSDFWKIIFETRSQLKNWHDIFSNIVTVFKKILRFTLNAICSYVRRMIFQVLSGLAERGKTKVLWMLQPHAYLDRMGDRYNINVRMWDIRIIIIYIHHVYIIILFGINPFFRPVLMFLVLGK